MTMLKNYWVRIAVGALAVFAVGMGLIHLGRAARSSFEHKLASSEPITIPLAFLPFQVDHHKVGTLQRVVILRSDPRHLSGVNLSVSTDSTAALERLQGCHLMVDFRATTSRGKLDFSQGEFSCLKDTTGRNLVSFGEIHFMPGGVTSPLLIRRAVAETLRQHQLDLHLDRDSADSLHAWAESVRVSAESLRVNADSIRVEVQGRAESLKVKVKQPRAPATSSPKPQ
jgi:hypothetical protein